MGTSEGGVERNRWPRVERCARQARTCTLRRRGIKPARKQWMVCVETTAIEIPGWAREKAEKSLSASAHHVWFRGRRNGRAKILAQQDLAAGGTPEITVMEWRKCSVCGRMLLNLEAEDKRRLDESSPAGRKLACSGECL